ncbi:Disease resistance protein [Quillaja saponaria]|uniref:Disease resistance protein n=1 Tax=Quillaja saponaria TaxID=32244 RepID=A0AAD7LM98_QUISA|nr:Disease resistance protein [Quillaja saponaria]
MAAILISIVAKIAEYPVEPILRQISYVINFNKNVNNLGDQAQKLQALKQQVNQAIESARRNGEVIEAEVQSWLSNVDEIIEKVEIILDQSKANKNCLSGFCPNCIFHYRVSRTSTKKAIVVAELQEQGYFNRVSYRPPLPSIEFSSSKDFLSFSHKETVNQIMDALKDDNIDVIALHGVRGIGKTALAKEVGKQAKELKLIDQVVMALVSSKTPELKLIQGQLADMLGLKFQEESTAGRARRLYKRLKIEKKILIILDDVWGELDLEAIGIPFAIDHKGCKILLTTKNEAVCRNIGVRPKQILFNALSEDESWTLFKSSAGDIVESPTFNPVAKDIVLNCKGLPLMLVKFGKSLRNKRLEEWRDLCRQISKFEDF